MSMKFRDKDGNETLIAGMGRSGELVPSVSYYQSGTASFSDLTTQATETVTVTLDTAMPDSDYVVVLNVANGVGYVVTSKSESAFTVRLQNLRTSTISAGSFTWQAFKLMTDESRALDEAQIEENKTNIASLTEGIPLQTPPSIDCNELIGVSGKRVCYLNNNTITSNSPVAAYGVLIVDRYDVRTYQKYVATSASDDYVEYTRMSARNTSTSSWTAWVKTAKATDLLSFSPSFSGIKTFTVPANSTAAQTQSGGNNAVAVAGGRYLVSLHAYSLSASDTVDVRISKSDGTAITFWEASVILTGTQKASTVFVGNFSNTTAGQLYITVVPQGKQASQYDVTAELLLVKLN